MSTLHEQLQAAINERLARARAATVGPWIVDHDGEDWWLLGGGAYLSAEEHGIASSFELNRRAEADIAFIAANDPARIIRDCERDVKVLARHEPNVFPPAVAERFGGDPWCGVCRLDPASATWPCPEIVDLAEAYDITEAPTTSDGVR